MSKATKSSMPNRNLKYLLFTKKQKRQKEMESYIIKLIVGTEYEMRNDRTMQVQTVHSFLLATERGQGTK